MCVKDLAIVYIHWESLKKIKLVILYVCQRFGDSVHVYGFFMVLIVRTLFECWICNFMLGVGEGDNV